MKLKMLFSIFMTFLFVGSLDLVYAQETVRLHGSTTVQKKIIEPAKDAIEKTLGIKLSIVGNGTGNGLADLVKDKADAAMSGEELSEAIESMEAATGIKAPEGLSLI
ncbi:MAG: substrate-binding domain-containing protein, partial [Thermodesulfovibrionales bacterium]|nr:substrate-binding domain-containing protein [Thermodesulfovibrionales bacterium]